VLERQPSRIASQRRYVHACLNENEFISVGREGTYLWDVNTLTQLHSPAGAGVRAATSAVTWADLRESSETELLFFGTQLGYLVCWSRKKDEEVRVHSQTWTFLRRLRILVKNLHTYWPIVPRLRAFNLTVRRQDSPCATEAG